MVFLAARSLQVLDVASPAEIFARTGRVLRDLGLPPAGEYSIELASVANEQAVASSCGLVFTPASF